jgi:hypothetical protein
MIYQKFAALTPALSHLERGAELFHPMVLIKENEGCNRNNV